MIEFLDRLQRIFGIDHNTSSTIIITILVFAIGQFLNWSAKRIASLQNNKSLRIIHLASIDTMQESFGKIQQEFLRVADGLNLKLGPVPPFFNAPTEFYAINAEMTTKEIMQAYTSGYFSILRYKQKRKILSSIFKVIQVNDSSKYILDQSKEDYVNYITSRNKYQAQWNELGGSFGQELDKYISTETSNDEKQIAHNYFKSELTRIQAEWLRTKDYNQYDILNRRLLIPVRILCRKVDLPEARSLAQIALRMSQAFMNIRSLTKTFSSQFKHYSDSFNTFIEQLEGIKGFLV